MVVASGTDIVIIHTPDSEFFYETLPMSHLCGVCVCVCVCLCISLFAHLPFCKHIFLVSLPVEKEAAMRCGQIRKRLIHGLGI